MIIVEGEVEISLQMKKKPHPRWAPKSSPGPLSSDDDSEPPTIKLGAASVAAPFTSKLANVVAIANIIRQRRCTLDYTAGGTCACWAGPSRSMGALVSLSPSVSHSSHPGPRRARSSSERSS